jgi:hypothetical protein
LNPCFSGVSHKASFTVLGTTAQGASTKHAPSPYILLVEKFSTRLPAVVRKGLSYQDKLLHSQPFGSSLDLDDDLALGASLRQVFKRFLRLIERKHLVDHRTNAFRFEESANFGELGAVGTYE